MYCDACGNPMGSDQQFCPRCGKRAASAPLLPGQSRVGGHLSLLGIFWIALSAFRLLPGMAMIFAFPAIAHYIPPEFRHFVPMIAVFGIFFLVVGAGLGFLAGWGLLQRKSWARILALVLGTLSLLDVPLGTALGIYTLWVLLPARSEEEFRQDSRAV
jgi:hypothetical protein